MESGTSWAPACGRRTRSRTRSWPGLVAIASCIRQRPTSDDPSPLKVKEVRVEGRRYVVCLNDDEARKDAADREAIVASLREKLRTGEKSLVGNKGYRRYLGSTGPDHFQIDEAKIEEEARYDGKWVLRTNMDLDTAEVALQYKRLWMVEAWFRSSKSLLQTRPIYHKCDCDRTPCRDHAANRIAAKQTYPPPTASRPIRHGLAKRIREPLSCSKSVWIKGGLPAALRLGRGESLSCCWADRGARRLSG